MTVASTWTITIQLYATLAPKFSPKLKNIFAVVMFDTVTMVLWLVTLIYVRELSYDFPYIVHENGSWVGDAFCGSSERFGLSVLAVVVLGALQWYVLVSPYTHQ